VIFFLSQLFRWHPDLEDLSSLALQEKQLSWVPTPDPQRLCHNNMCGFMLTFRGKFLWRGTQRRVSYKISGRKNF
jgi:hypothetical protein